MQSEARVSTNSIRVIQPYWSNGTWVFDDESVGLVREPFVAGVPEILNEMVQAIPNARSGFRLYFSDSPFPGHQGHFELFRAEYGGSWYRQVKSGAGAKAAEGWLCPALFKYFSQAPKDLYIQVAAL
jgi:hypothetical protein